jgi:hypothetical protein
MAGGVGQLVERGAIIVHLLKEGGLRRHLHEIFAWNVIGTITADAEIDARRGDHLLGDGHDLAFGERRGVGGETGTQPLALRE